MRPRVSTTCCGAAFQRATCSPPASTNGKNRWLKPANTRPTRSGGSKRRFRRKLPWRNEIATRCRRTKRFSKSSAGGHRPPLQARKEMSVEHGIARLKEVLAEARHETGKVI